MSEPFIGEIRMVGFNFAPTGWLPCQGQLVSISQNQALFALLGTTFGGNGVTNFALPDLRGRSPVGMGDGPGLTPVVQGEMAGQENVNVLVTNMPAHTHPTTVQVAGTATEPANTPSATNAVLGASGGGQGSAAIWSTALTNPVPMSGVQAGPAGGSQPLPVRNPYLGTNFIIATQGVFPSRP